MLTLTHVFHKLSQRIWRFCKAVPYQITFDNTVLALLIIYSVSIVAYPNLFFPWFINTEEFPYIQEILRFTELDFRQQFFDIPGTPLIFIGSVFWTLFYLICIVFGQADSSMGIRYFTFENMQSLYYLMRIISYVFYIISIVLTYKIAQRLTSSLGGLFAALLLALSPIYTLTIQHLRIEPMSLALVLLSIWCVLRAIDNQSYRDYLLSGVFAGLAMAARFPSVLAGLPVAIAYTFVAPQVFDSKKLQAINRFSFLAITSLLMFGGMVSLLFRFGHLHRNLITDVFLLTAEGQYPKATQITQNLWLIFLIISVSIFSLYYFPYTRSTVKKLVYSSAAVVISGFCLGLFIGVPTLLWSGNYFLASVENFSNRNQVGQSFIRNFGDFLYFYFFGFSEETSLSAFFIPNFTPIQVGIIYTFWQALLLIIGIFLIVRNRNKLLYPILLGAVIGVLSQYGKLQTTRHLIAWLPYFLILMALPVSFLFNWFSITFKSRRLLKGFAISMFFLCFITTYKVQANLLQVASYESQEKAILLPQMTQWLRQNVGQEKIFHHCCKVVDEETILDWISRNGILIPEGVRETENSIIWFGNREALEEVGKGYIVISLDTFQKRSIDYYKKMSPKSVVDPFNDQSFTLKKIIDGGTGNRYQIYYFDLVQQN